MTLVAGVDSSTQSCKVVIRDLESGDVVRTGRAPHPDCTEVDPESWWSALLAAIDNAGGLADVAAIAVGGQQHGMVVLDAAGKVIRPALLWNDTRSAPAAVELIAELGAVAFATRTGSVPVASFTLTKLRWLRDHEPENAARVAAVALPHDWLTWRLRGYGPAGRSPLGPRLDALSTDRSDASGTSYWNPVAGRYELDLLAHALRLSHSAGAPGYVGLPILPKVLAADAKAGALVDFGGASGRGGPATRPSSGRANVGAGAVVGAGMGDNAGAALGLAARPGDVIVSIGTSGTVFAVTDQHTHDASGTVAGFADAAGGYLPLVATLNAARVLERIAGLLDVDLDALATLALKAPPAANGVVLVPYFDGERTPNRPDASASLHGLTSISATRTDLARAAVEGMLCGLADGLDAIRRLGVPAHRLLLIGGAAQNPAVAVIAAQVFDLPVVVPEPAEYVARGATVQAAWVLTGSRPAWPLLLAAAPVPDYRPVIRANYARYASGIA